MIYALLILLAIAVLTGPSLWAKSILSKYAKPRPDFPGTGGQFAEHLLERHGMQHVRVEETEKGGDHYDLGAKAVRLSPDHLNGASLSAVVVAAHEVGHALQDEQNYLPLRAGAILQKSTAWLQNIGPVLIMVAPIIAAVTRAPSAMVLGLAAGVGLMGLGVVVQLINLPTEFDASFKRALPMLEAGQYIHPDDMPAARRILTACAMTYVAGALMQMINIARWLRFLRF